MFFDFDNDGLLDLFLTNVGVYTTNQRGRGGYYLALPDAFYGHLYPDRTEYSILYRNLGGGRFKDVSKEMNLRDGSWSGDATFADLNQDGYPDLYVLNMQGDDHYYENLAGRGFAEKTAAYFPKTPWGAMGVKFFDYNQDGLLDLFVTDMHSDMTRQQTEEALQFRSDIEKRKRLVWDIERRLAHEDARPILFYQRAANCVRPELHGLTTMANSTAPDASRRSNSASFCTTWVTSK